MSIRNDGFGRGSGVSAREFAAKPVTNQGARDTIAEEAPAVSTSKLLAAIIWLTGVAITQQVSAIFLPWWLSWPVAGIGQWLLTRLESPIWRRWRWDALTQEWERRPLGLLNMIGLAIDALLNISGAWLIVAQLHRFPPIQAISQIMGWHLGPVTGWPALILCLVLGLVVCGSPEMLWYDD